MADRTIRAMWLLNHTSARDFEVPMLKKIGISEIFLPKRFPQDINFRSASVDYSEDCFLTIPQDDLTLLNEADWYTGPSRAVWDIANKYFDLLFFIVFYPSIFRSIARHFKGAAIWRVYGAVNLSCTEIINFHTEEGEGQKNIKSLGRRFWFGTAYPHLHEGEGPLLRDRCIYLPLGLPDSASDDRWVGDIPAIFFICPDAAFNPYYQKILKDFQDNFNDFSYIVGGAQALAVNDPRVIGFVPHDQHMENLRRFRVMFYHSTEPNHIHYHPFEAVRAGMPLVFMGGGMLDRLGGHGLPGRCRSISEARKKIRRILDGDKDLIARIRTTQVRLLDSMRFENCEGAWRRGIAQIMGELDDCRSACPPPARRRPRLAVILPVQYRGGTLRGAKLLARALFEGSRCFSEDADIVLAHLDDPVSYPPECFDDLPKGVQRRPFKWKKYDLDAARRAMRYAGHENWVPSNFYYLVPDDGIQQFTDCDLWVVISDRLEAPLLPVRPYLLMIYDYLQRYLPFLQEDLNYKFLQTARRAERVLVTTRFTEQDALQYAGLRPDKVFLVPMLFDQFKEVDPPPPPGEPAYFVWSTNAGPQKNHLNAFRALQEYYENLGGKLECRVTGVETEDMLRSPKIHLKPLAGIVSASRDLQRMVRILGELPDSAYRVQLAGAAFLWHPGLLDNGTFSVLEAAYCGVPALSSDYPAMREIDAQFGLNLTWMDARRPKDMARQLRWMEENTAFTKARLPSHSNLSSKSVEHFAGEYWKVVRECL